MVIGPVCIASGSTISGAAVSMGAGGVCEMLREESMKPLGISINGPALELHVPVTRISPIVNERRGITADTAGKGH
jgi:plasmid maintenance system antidote protein VapI